MYFYPKTVTGANKDIDCFSIPSQDVARLETTNQQKKKMSGRS